MKELLRGESTISLEAAVLKCRSAELYLLPLGYISLLRALDLQRKKTILLRRELKEYSALAILHDSIVGHA
jgi:hypothetical protein